MFYAPWCGHCKSFKPEMEKAAIRLAGNKNLLLAKMDYTKNEVDNLEIKGYPTILYFASNNRPNSIDFDGGREAEGVINWLKQHAV